MIKYTKKHRRYKSGFIDGRIINNVTNGNSLISNEDKKIKDITYDDFLYAFYFNTKFRNKVFPYLLKKQSEIISENKLKELNKQFVKYSLDDPKERKEVDYKRIGKCLWEIRNWIIHEYNSVGLRKYLKDHNIVLFSKRMVGWINNVDVMNKVMFRKNTHYKSRIYAEVVVKRKQPTKSLFRPPYFKGHLNV